VVVRLVGGRFHVRSGGLMMGKGSDDGDCN
jgi:hypothetical protein